VLRDERPPVPEAMPEAYALLMSRCWQADPMLRPGFDTVLRLINLMIEDMVDPEDVPPEPPAFATLSGSAPGSGPVAASGGGAGARVSSGGGGAAAPSRDNSHFFQDL
jgi:hypothetical protein